MHSFLLLLACCIPTVVTTQQVYRTFDNLWTLPARAAPMVAVEDLDGDGLREMLIGETSDPYGELRILVGDSGQLFLRLAFDEFKLGTRVAFIGDVTGDGFGDFLGSGYLGDRGHLWDGASMARIWDGQSFDSAAAVGDVDGDGIGDFVLAAYGIPGLQGRATAYRGGDIQPLYTVSPPGAVRFGLEATALGDLDRDGVGDFAVGATSSPFAEGCSAGEVYVYSGQDGNLIHRLVGEGVNSVFGEFVAAVGDVTGDGIDDFAVSAQLCCALTCEGLGPGRVSLFDGASGKLIEHVTPPPGVQRFGILMEGVGDLDGNGHGDLLVQGLVLNGNASSLLGVLFAIDGGTRQVIYSHRNEGCVRGGFVQMVGVGDQDGDDFPDYYLSAICGRIGSAEDRVDIVSGAPIGVRTLGVPCGLGSGKPLRIGATGVPRIGSEYALHLTGIPPGVEARLLVGTLPASPSRTPRTLRCPLVEPVEVQRVLSKSLRPGEGVATVIVPIPNRLELIGTRTYAQWLVRDGALTRASRILELELQPTSPYRTR